MKAELLAKLSYLVHCVLQEQLQDQVQTIQKLEDTVRQQAEDLNWTQSQLLSTQGSLIDLETHLTTLEEQQATADEAAAASQQQSDTAPMSPSSLRGNTQPPGASAGKKLKLKEDLLPTSPSQGGDPVQAAFVNSIDSMFPPSGEDSEVGDMPDLPKDPYELFERGKAAVQARASNQNKDMADVPELKEDPYELFERGKAAVQSRASKQKKKGKSPKGKQRPSS